MTSGPGPKNRENELLRLAIADPKSRDGRRAASELLGQYQQRVYLWCYRYVREHEKALDLAQEVLMKAYQSLPGFEGRADFGTWLFAITRNLCLSQLRRPPLLEEPGVDPDGLYSSQPDPETRLLESLGEEGVLELINQTLDTVERTALWLRCFEGAAVDEITRILDLDETSGARAVLQRARRKLRRALQQRENEKG